MGRRLKYICLEMVRAGKTESVYDVKRAEDIIHNIQIPMLVSSAYDGDKFNQG